MAAPTLTTDGDGIPDATDQCPLEAETKNGRDDEDGCPDKIRLDREQKQIVILDPVQFAKNILEASFDMLTEIAEALKVHTDISAVRIEGHTDSQGSDRKNKQLSEARAISVLEFLVRHGVEASRLYLVHRALGLLEHSNQRRVGAVSFAVERGDGGHELHAGRDRDRRQPNLHHVVAHHADGGRLVGSVLGYELIKVTFKSP